MQETTAVLWVIPAVRPSVSKLSPSSPCHCEETDAQGGRGFAVMGSWETEVLLLHGADMKKAILKAWYRERPVEVAQGRLLPHVEGLCLCILLVMLFCRGQERASLF